MFGSRLLAIVAAAGLAASSHAVTVMASPTGGAAAPDAVRAISAFETSGTTAAAPDAAPRTLFGPRESSATMELNSGSAPVQRDTIAVATVPEPAVWALLLGGFAFTGNARRRARTRAVAA